jgi:HIP---CoA ligase
MNGDGYLKVCDIGEAAFVGVPDAHFGEVCAAFVVPATGVRLTAEDVIAFAKEMMAHDKEPRRVEILDALPLNATGKVVKDQLQERATR